MTPACACGCCAGVSAATPRPVENRHGLPVVPYRVGTHAEFLASLTAALSAADRPALARLRTRDPRDFTMALLDGVATVCDVLTFYTERLAQESWLRTAVDRTSLQELGRLVAYRLRPGVAATTHLALFIEPPPAPPPSGSGPGFVPAPYLTGGLELPVGLPVRSVPGPGEQPQTFETTEAIVARPEWNALRGSTTKLTILGSGDAVAYLAGTGANLKVGDMLLFTGGTPRLAAVSGVLLQPDDARTRVTWKPALSGAASQISVLRKRLRVFGYNAPPFSVFPEPPESMSDWAWTLSGADGAVDIDGSHPDILPGSTLVLVAGTSSLVVTADSVVELSRADYAIAGPITRVFVSEDLGDVDDQVRQTVVYAVNEPLTLAHEPDDSDVDGLFLVVDGDVEVPDGRTLLVAGRDAATGEALTELVTPVGSFHAPGFTAFQLDKELTGTYRRDTVVVYGNVVAATHGETVHQVLGGGDASRPHQAFELKHQPLTYVPSDEPGGAASTLEVRVNDVAWHEVPTLYPAGPEDRSFVTRDTERGTVVVRFGDGIQGARLPTGSHNVRAVYRRGVGLAGNLPAGSISQVMDPPLGLTKVTNPVPAAGGADPETPAVARESIPLAVRTLGRAVSLLDYANYARAFAGVAKSHAAVLNLAGGRTIVVTVAAADGVAVTADARARLLTSLRSHGDPLVAVEVLAHRSAAFRVAMRVRRDPDHLWDAVQTAVRDEVTRAFGFAVRDFGQPVHLSEVVAAAHRAPGVVAVDVDRLYRVAEPIPPEPDWPPPDPDQLSDRLRAALPRPDMDAMALPAELLTIDADPFDYVEEMT